MISFILASVFLSLAAAHLPYLDAQNSHNSIHTAFSFPDNIYSRALLTTTTCPPRYYNHGNKTHTQPATARAKPWSRYSWSKVYVGGDECLTFEFGVPHIPALEYPSFRPTVYLVGECLPPARAFGYPEPQPLEYPPFDLPSGYRATALRFHLADPIWEAEKIDEPRLDATLLSYLNYSVPVKCSGEVYIVVETHEKRVVEYYVAVGELEELPASTAGVATLAEARAWAQGEDKRVGQYCPRRGIWERE
ncbi:hypothetical protein Dda_1246 [Drechslerella dactyloides]|uniref:Uncharacterized protein n=1 Tax=Drechslerella dactyloides TaxID=74499 RepID=A0AAD6NLU0_DREDA|nr:hypothetical protein Dda_1246 [Drechslerella dactyloides]